MLKILHYFYYIAILFICLQSCNNCCSAYDINVNYGIGYISQNYKTPYELMCDLEGQDNICFKEFDSVKRACYYTAKKTIITTKKEKIKYIDILAKKNNNYTVTFYGKRIINTNLDFYPLFKVQIPFGEEFSGKPYLLEKNSSVNVFLSRTSYGEYRILIGNDPKQKK